MKNTLAYCDDELITTKSVICAINGVANKLECLSAARPVRKVESGNPNRSRRLSTVDLLIRVTSFAKKKILFSISKAADPNKLVQGDQLYRAFPFSEGSLVECFGTLFLSSSKIS